MCQKDPWYFSCNFSKHRLILVMAENTYRLDCRPCYWDEKYDCSFYSKAGWENHVKCRPIADNMLINISWFLKFNLCNLFYFRPHLCDAYNAAYCYTCHTFSGPCVREHGKNGCTDRSIHAVWQPWEETRVDPRNQVLDGIAHWRYLANATERSLHAVMRSFVKWRWTLAVTTGCSVQPMR